MKRMNKKGSNLTFMVIILLALDLIMFLGQQTLINAFPEENATSGFYDCNMGVLTNMNTENCNNQTFGVNSDIYSYLPSTETLVTAVFVAGVSGIFGLSLIAIVLVFFGTLAILTYVVNIAFLPYQILVVMGLPSAVAFGIGAFYVIIHIFLILAFIFWRGD